MGGLIRARGLGVYIYLYILLKCILQVRQLSNTYFFLFFSHRNFAVGIFKLVWTLWYSQSILASLSLHIDPLSSYCLFARLEQLPKVLRQQTTQGSMCDAQSTKQEA